MQLQVVSKKDVGLRNERDPLIRFYMCYVNDGSA